jgi:6-phosphofructokinase
MNQFHVYDVPLPINLEQEKTKQKSLDKAIEEEKTKQEQEQTKQEQEKTKQLKLQLKILESKKRNRKNII